MPIIICFEGRLATDPVAAQTTNDTPVTDAVLMINHRREGDDGKWVDTSPATRYSIKAWRGRATALAAKKKGDSLVVIGHVKTESWTTADGSKRYQDIVIADAIGESLRT